MSGLYLVGGRCVIILRSQWIMSTLWAAAWFRRRTTSKMSENIREKWKWLNGQTRVCGAKIYVQVYKKQEMLKNISRMQKCCPLLTSQARHVTTHQNLEVKYLVTLFSSDFHTYFSIYIQIRQLWLFCIIFQLRFWCCIFLIMNTRFIVVVVNALVFSIVKNFFNYRRNHLSFSFFFLQRKWTKSKKSSQFVKRKRNKKN